jgi:glycosyltransferase involved in cell wall biosynthesis
MEGRESVLRRAISSVREATLSVELVIASSTSTRQFSDLKASFPQKTFTFVSYDGKGNASENRNKALDVARGRYVAFLDDDDEFTEGKLALQLEFMTSYRASWAFTNYFLCTERRMEACTLFSARSMLRGNLDFRKNCAIATPTVMVERELLEKGGLRFDTDLSIREDIDFWNRLLDCSPALYIPFPLSKVHRGQDNSFLAERRLSAETGLPIRIVGSLTNAHRHIADRIDRRSGRARFVFSHRAH